MFTSTDVDTLRVGVKKKSIKKLKIHKIKKNYKYSKFLFLNTLRCNYLLIKTKTKIK